MLPVGVNLFVIGSKSSALALPPATNTLPFINRVAVWPLRAVFMLPATVKPEGDPSTGAMTLKATELVETSGMSPIASPVSTQTWAVTGSINSAELTAVSWVSLMNVVDKVVFLPLTVHSA